MYYKKTSVILRAFARRIQGIIHWIVLSPNPLAQL